jgi:hypothetical protein
MRWLVSSGLRRSLGLVQDQQAKTADHASMQVRHVDHHIAFATAVKGELAIAEVGRSHGDQAPGKGGVMVFHQGRVWEAGWRRLHHDQYSRRQRSLMISSLPSCASRASWVRHWRDPGPRHWRPDLWRPSTPSAGHPEGGSLLRLVPSTWDQASLPPGEFLISLLMTRMC